MPQSDIRTRIKPLEAVKEPPMYRVVYINDSHTTMEFVIESLIDYFDYTIGDGRGGVVTKTVNVTVNSIKDALVGGLESISLEEDNSVEINLFANINDIDNDADNDKLIAVINTPPSQGNLIENQDGTWQYNPNHNFNGNDYFEYQVFDGDGESIIKNVNIVVSPVNDDPSSNLISEG
jgi:VCBS repeat-containing protein